MSAPIKPFRVAISLLVWPLGTCPACQPCPSGSIPMPGYAMCMGSMRVRKVGHNGSIVLDDVSYSVKHTLAGQYIDISVDASTRQLVIWFRHQPLKRLAIKGLPNRLMPFEEFVTLMAQQACSQQRRQERARWRARLGAALA